MKGNFFQDHSRRRREQGEGLMWSRDFIGQMVAGSGKKLFETSSGLLTGYNTIRRNLTLIGVAEDARCRK